jgi:hypothetical protein
MSSLRSTRGYTSVTLDRLRYGNVVTPGVLAVGNDGVVEPTSAVNAETLNISGTAILNNAVINNILIDDVVFKSINVQDVSTNTIEVTGTGTVGYLNVGGFTGATGFVDDLTVNKLHVLKYIDNVNIVASVEANYIAGAKIRAGDESAANAQTQLQELYVVGDAFVTDSVNCPSININNGSFTSVAMGMGPISIEAQGDIECQNLNAVGIVSAINDGSAPGTVRLENDISGTGAVDWIYDGQRVYMSVYPKPTGTTRVEVESTPLIAGIAGPAGVAGAVGDKYIKQSMQVGQGLYVMGGVTGGYFTTTGAIQGGSLNITGGVTGGYFTTTGAIQGGSLNVTGGVTGGSFTTAGAIQGGSLNITGGVTGGYFTTTGAIQGGSLSTIKVYTNTITPYPDGAKDPLTITGGAVITNGNTDDPADAAYITISQEKIGEGNGSAKFVYVGSDSSGYGGTNNDKEQFCLFTYPKPLSGPQAKVEATPLAAGTTGPAGVTGAVGDKYFYGSVQVGGNLHGATGSFQNLTVNNLLTINGAIVYGVQIL